MKVAKPFVVNLIRAIMAGISISLGCIIYMMCENKVIGAIAFTLGLFLVLTNGYHLFTGKIAYVLENKMSYTFNMVLMWFGNAIGALLISTMIKFTKLNYLKEIALNITNNKLSQTPLSAFIMAMFCGFIIYWAVENFKNNPHDVGKYIGMFILIPIFILCGFEHCVANMFYFIFAEVLTFKSILYIIIITIGNTIGSIILRLLERYISAIK
jgi:formate/nitrite transporter FocA (FNT family)